LAKTIYKLTSSRIININYRESYVFATYNNDIKKITTDRCFLISLLKYLQIKINGSDSFEDLITIINNYNLKYRILPTSEFLKNVRNEQDIITLEYLKDIPEKRIVLIEKRNGKHDGFDVINLRNWLSTDKKEKRVNPLTTNEINNDDMKKINGVNVNCINYFT